jgi:hypothetical protein
MGKLDKVALDPEKGIVLTQTRDKSEEGSCTPGRQSRLIDASFSDTKVKKTTTGGSTRP